MRKKNFMLVLSFILLLSFVLPVKHIQAKQTFSDVPTEHMYFNEISYLLDKGVIDAKSNYGINDIVTREEVAVMIAKATGLDGTPRATKFSDIPKSHKNSGYIQSAVEAGIINGYPDGTFGPNKQVTRGQMAAFIGRAFKLPTGNKTFKDVNSSTTGYEFVGSLAAANITTGYTDGTFKPYGNLSRAHLSVFVYRAMQHAQPSSVSAPESNKVYKNCTELRKDFPNGVDSTHWAYQTKMDRDKDGWACE